MQKDSTNVNCRTGEVPGPPWPQSSLMMGDKWGGGGFQGAEMSLGFWGS